MKTNYYEKSKEELNNRYDKYLKERNRCANNSYIIEQNKFENRTLPFFGGTAIIFLLLNVGCIFLTGHHMAFHITEGVNYLLPFCNIIPADYLPLLLMGVSAGIGKVFSAISEKFTQYKKRFKEISKAKSDKAKIEEIAKYNIKSEQMTNRYKIITEVLDRLAQDHKSLDELDKKYDLSYTCLPQTEEDTDKAIDNLSQQLKEKYTELDLITTKKVMHEMFYKSRFRSNRFDKAFNNAALLWVITSTVTVLTHIFFGNVLPFTNTGKLIYALVSILGGGVFANTIAIKQARDPYKVFNKMNKELGSKGFAKKPNKDEQEELNEIYKDFYRTQLQIINLEVQLQEQNRIKEIFEGFKKDGNVLVVDKGYEDLCNDTKEELVPLMESHDVTPIIENNNPRVFIKK